MRDVDDEDDEDDLQDPAVLSVCGYVDQQNCNITLQSSVVMAAVRYERELYYIWISAP